MGLDNNILKEIKSLYLDGYSSNEIKRILLEKYNFSVCDLTIRKKLRKMGVKIRNKRESIILRYRRNQPVDEILKLYKEGRPVRELSRKLGIARRSISKILEENKVEKRNSRVALISMGHIQEKKKFKLDSKEKAYLFALVMGDLTPVRKSNYTLKLITHTTHMTFIDFLCKTFGRYGTASFGRTKKDFRFQAFLDLESFSFLLDSKKGKIPYWINNKNFLDFLAGFIDSDGSVLIKKSNTRFVYSIRFYGQNLALLLSIRKRLEKLGYSLSIHKNHSKGDMSFHRGVKFVYNKDYYALEIQSKNQVLDLINKLPIRHPEKIARRKLILSINKKGLLYWKDVEEDIKELRLLIKQSVLLERSIY